VTAGAQARRYKAKPQAQAQTQAKGRELTVDLSAVYDPRRNEKQMLFHRAPDTYKLFGGGMGGGKTASLINEGNQLNLDYPGNFGLLMRKTWPSFRDTMMPQLEKFLDLGLVWDWNHSEKLITYRNKSRIRYGGIGDAPDDWQRFMSGEYGWIALDQAEEFTETEFLMLSTRLRLNLTGLRHHFLLSCNPTQGWIKRRFLEQKLKDHVFIESLPEDNVQNLPADYLPRMRSVLPARQQAIYLGGDWSAVGEPDDVYPYLEIKAAQERQVEPGLPVELGIDVARHGDDETTILLQEGLRVTIVSRAQGHDTMRTVGDVWIALDKFVVPRWSGRLQELRIKVDADGLGGGVVDRLVELREEKSKYYGFEIKVLEIHGSARPADPVHFKNLRAEVHWGLKELLPYLSLPEDSDLKTQLLAIKYRVNSAGQVEIVPKDEIKHRLKFSPDLAEGLIYCVAPMLEPEVRKGKVWFTGKTRPEIPRPGAEAAGQVPNPEAPPAPQPGPWRPVAPAERKGRIYVLGRQSGKGESHGG
jgi:hypothetical protein